VPQRLIRAGDLRQRRARVALLPARLPAALAAQRLRRCLDKRRIRRRRLDEFRLFLPPTGRRNSASSVSSWGIRLACAATRAPSSAYDGNPDPLAPHYGQRIEAEIN
jgi:hypothetical protein